jgi:GNAT superfamily N-acetyltransferase
MSINIRPATPADIDHLVKWNAAMAWETEHKHLDEAVLRPGTEAVFADPRRGTYLVAELDGIPAGSLLITYEWSDWRNGDFWWVQSVYVAEEARRRGVFRALYQAVKERAKEAGAVGTRLYVETENTRAQSTYASLGMERCDYAMLEQIFS